MDYSKLSDFEINKRVAIATGHKKFNSLGWQGAQEEGCSAVVVRGPMRIGVFDPCNDAADAWPIIVANGISLNHYTGTWEASYEYDAPIGAFGTDETVTCAIEHKNPLRAAMIAFLLMQESQHA